MNTSTTGPALTSLGTYVTNGEALTATPTYLDMTTKWFDTSSFQGYVTSGTTLNLNTNKMTVTQTKVAVFELIRNEKNEITDTKFIKELWVQTKNGSSLDFQVAKDAEISKYDPQSISIRIIYTLSF
jgi:maltoporin